MSPLGSSLVALRAPDAAGLNDDLKVQLGPLDIFLLISAPLNQFGKHRFVRVFVFTKMTKMTMKEAAHGRW